ncbi:MAG: AraC family transcriptional regulator [Ruminococcaceae bacterium]|nr:AraC family transcriptional regulator [Oscillospiraceae bacterium]
MKKYKFSDGAFEYSHSIDNKISEKLSTRHCHDLYEILYVANGRGRYLIEGARFDLKPRTLLLIRPLAYHCVEVECESDYERRVLHFDASMVSKDVRDILDKMAGAEDFESGSFFSPGSLSQDIISLFDKFDRADQLPESERALYIKLVLSEMILLLSIASKERIAHDNRDIAAQVAKYINDYLEYKISLDSIAKRFFVSKYYLCRTFKKYSGVSIHSYITNKRVIYAKKLIEAGETASGAAYKVGFGDYSAFYRAYVKILGTPPTHK